MKKTRQDSLSFVASQKRFPPRANRLKLIILTPEQIVSNLERKLLARIFSTRVRRTSPVVRLSVFSGKNGAQVTKVSFNDHFPCGMTRTASLVNIGFPKCLYLQILGIIFPGCILRQAGQESVLLQYFFTTFPKNSVPPQQKKSTFSVPEVQTK